MATPAPRTDAASITPVEPVVVERDGDPERFARANRIADRFLDNIEQVVYGKRDEIKLVLTALACGGHVLLEDVPGTSSSSTWPSHASAVSTSLISSRLP